MQTLIKKLKSRALKACPACKNNSINTGVILPKEQVHCSECYARYQYKVPYNFLKNFILKLLASIPIPIGFITQSWPAFFLAYIVGLLIIYTFLDFEKKLIPTGLRARSVTKNTFKQSTPVSSLTDK